MHTRIGLSIITLVLFLILLTAQTPAVQGEPSVVEAHQNLAIDPSGRVVDMAFDQDLALNAPWDRFRFDMNSVQPLARDRGAFLGDLTGDGVLDLVVASFTGERLFFPGMNGRPSQFGDGLYLQHTTANSSEDPFHDNGQDGLWVSGDIGDLDGDGNKEIAIGMKLYAIIGTAAEPKLDLRYTFESSDPVWDPSPSIGDLNGDGKPDVVITYQSDSKSNDTYVYWNNSTPGSYSFNKGLLYHWDSKLVTSSRVALGDLNGDGLRDLAGPAGIYFNTGTSTTPDFAFAAPVTWNKTGGPDWTATNDQPGHVFLKDADGDGLLDAYVSNLSSTVWQVLFYRNVGTASAHDLRYIGPVVAASSPLDLAERGKTIPDSYPYQSFLAQGDVDENGRQDVLVGTGGGETSGAPTILWHFPLEGGEGAQGLSYQDLYSWPALDRVSYSCGGTTDALCRPPNLLSAWTDLATDSMPDGLRADEWSNPTGSYELYIRARSGTMPFTLSGEVPLLTNPSNSQAYARGVALMDVDNDGFLDMVTGAADGRLLFYRNTGNPGSFADPVPLRDSTGTPIGVGEYSWPAAIDLDGDGDRDLLVITGDGRIHKVMCISPGSVQGYSATGLLGTPEQDPVKVIHTTAKDQSLATLDVEGDGRQDVLIGDSNDRVWLLKNVGTSAAASFSLRPLTVSRTSAASLEILASRQIRLYFALPTFAGDTVISYHNLPTNGPALSGQVTISNLAVPTDTPTSRTTPSITATGTLTRTPTSTATFTVTSTPTKSLQPSRTPTRTRTPTFTPTPKLVSVENEDYRIQYDGWRGVKDSHANGGSYRLSNTAGDDITFKFSGSSVKWVTRKGPDLGMALVTIDGAKKYTISLYNNSVVWKAQQTFSKLGGGAHSLLLTVLADKNPASTNTNVAVDAFIVGATTTQDNSRLVQYCDWKSATAKGPSGGSYRANGFAAGVAKLTFSGSGVDWITAKGPKFGQAEIFIDDVEHGTYNLNQPSTQWKFPITFTGLTPGTHTIMVRPLGDAAVVVDAFKGHITAMGSSQEPGASRELGDTIWWSWFLPSQAVRQSLSLGQ